MFDVGRLCVKTAGREIGKHCVVIGKVKEDGFVLVTGPKSATGVRRRRCNLAHLRPLDEVITIKADATDEEILSIYEKMNFYEKFGVKQHKPFSGKKTERKPATATEKKDKPALEKKEKAAPVKAAAAKAVPAKAEK